eukprot:bmy_11341T0
MSESLGAGRAKAGFLLEGPSTKGAEKLYNSSGRDLRRALFSLKQIFQDDKDLVHEFVVAEGLTCLIKVGAEADQNYQNYILRVIKKRTFCTLGSL